MSPADDNLGLHHQRRSPVGTEERAWILLNSREQPPVDTNTRAVRTSDRFHTPECGSHILPSLIAEMSMDGEGKGVPCPPVFERVSGDPERSDGCCCVDHLHELCCGDQATNTRNMESAGHILAMGKSGRPTNSNDVCNECDCTSLRSSELVCSDDQGGMGQSGEDPVLLSLLHRLGEIEAELERRHSLQVWHISGDEARE